MDIAVVIPCCNEEISIKNVILDYQQYFERIYVIDNNCTDNTIPIATSLGAIVIKAPIKGKGAAIRKAFEALDEELLVLTDGDCTYSASDSNHLVQTMLEAKVDMVVGNRLSSEYFKHNQIINGFGNRVFSFIASKKYKTKVPDLLSGSRVVRKQFYKNISILNDGFEVETELTKQCILSEDYRIMYENISYSRRLEGSESSIHILKDGFKILKTI